MSNCPSSPPGSVNCHCAPARRLAWLAVGWLLPVAMLASGCAPLAPATAVAPRAASGAAAAALSDAERAFMARAAANGLYEVQVSRLAASRATSPLVRGYAQQVASREAQALDELSALMRAKGVQPPSALAADKATKLHRLAALKPSAAFDQGYVQVVGVEDRQASISMFEKARAQTRDRDLRAWIDKMLPVLRNELAGARDLGGTPAG